MTPENFCYWLQGYFEIVKHIDHREGLSKEALQVIEDHLKEVFDKRTPNRDNGVQQGPVTDQLARPPEFRMPTIDWNGIRQPGGIGPIIC
ncbi:hypothetical protein Roomu2_00066 [Pseudomonas phage vB_PpuM-Roomu-2]|uniref:Uncharacterized protein n=1 Tax=Pseudomonas phage vB_PpuM-Roomu-2 TaxID=3132621 RepID=A0AAX4N0D0_9CAUD